MSESKLISQIGFSVLLLATIISKRLNCEALALKPNLNRLPQLSYPKGSVNKAIPVIDNKLGNGLPPSILSDYYNSIISNSGQNFRRLPVSAGWAQPDFNPYSNLVDNEYDTNGDEYYNSDDNSDAIRSAASDISYGSDVYQPEGWFNGPIIYDTPESNVQNDESNDAQLNTFLMAYLLEQFDRLNQLKDLSEKRGIELKTENKDIVSTSTQSSVTTSTAATKVTTNAIPKKLSLKQFRISQRGQKEFPLLRPAADNDDKTSENLDPEWPTELDEKNLSEEDSLMSLKQQKGQLRTVRDILTAQLDNLKKEGPKMH